MNGDNSCNPNDIHVACDMILMNNVLHIEGWSGTLSYLLQYTIALKRKFYFVLIHDELNYN